MLLFSFIMSRSKEHRQPVEPNPIEQSRKAVSGFIASVKTVLDDNHALGVEWEHKMNMLYGNEELLRITKNEDYKGIPGVYDELQAAHQQGGLMLLRARFLMHLVEHTDIQEGMGEATQTAVGRIMDFK